MLFPSHLKNCVVKLQAPTQTKTTGVPVLSYSDTYTGVEGRIWPDSSFESLALQRETGTRRSTGFFQVSNAAGTSMLIGKDWRVVVTAVYPQAGGSQLAANQTFRVVGPAINPAGHDVAQVVTLEEVS